jgi:glycerate kinase
MRILIAPDKFKGSISATAAAEAMAAGVRAGLPEAELDLCPLADGGEGTVSAMLKACGGRLVTRRVTGPLPEMKVDASFAMLADGTTAVIEMSAASGLALLPVADRDPLHTTTFGTGELMAAAVREGAKKIILGLGGSATIDAGIGCAQACGFTVLMRDGEPTSLTEPLCGRDVSNVLMVKHGRGEITTGVEIVGASDVSNPLLGESGAAKIFGPQKGASPAVAAHLDVQLREFATRINALSDAQRPGSGAAGGMGFGVLAFFRGQVQSGFDLVAGAAALSDRLKEADLCLTGEGRLDGQSFSGKTAVGVARLCQSAGVPCIALVGWYNADVMMLAEHGVTAVFSICDGPMPIEVAMTDVTRLLRQSAHNCARVCARVWGSR